MTNNPKFIADGFTTLLGGVDESRQPLLLRQDQVSRAINITFRDGFARSRPPYSKRNLRFERGEYGLWFIDHPFQGADYYDNFLGSEKVIASVGGRIFSIEPCNGYLVRDITPRAVTTTTAQFTANTAATVAVTVSDAAKIFAGYPIYIGGKQYIVDSKSGNTLTVTNVEEINGTIVASGSTVEYLNPNSATRPHAWFVQAEQYMVIQDGQSGPIIYDGASTRRAVPGREIPAGGPMAYGNGRIWLAMNDGREYAAGDIAGGPTGVLGFTENTYLFGGGSFRVPASVGRIRAMRFVMNLDTSLGQGPLQILCDRAIFSVNAPVAREAWAGVTNPIQTVSLINFGATSQAGTALINGDLFFRAEDGFRSFIIARRDFGTWGNTPISGEMNRLLDKDTQELLGFASAAMFDNRLLFTVTPQPGRNGVRHKALVVLDFDLISTLGGKMPPAYDGFWTGVDVTGIVTGRFSGKNRCFLFSHDGDGYNDFWELEKEGKFDSGENPIEWVIETKSFSFQGGGPTGGLKGLENAEIWISEFAKELSLTLQFRPDQYPCWQDWGTKTICVDSPCDEESACESTTSGNLNGYKTRIGFGKPTENGNTSDERSMLAGFSFQIRITGTGYAHVSRFVVNAKENEEWPLESPVDDRSTCRAIACCPPNPYEYVSRLGPPQPPVLMQTSALSSNAILAFRYQPGLHYVLWGYFPDDGEQVLVEFPPDDDDTWEDPDGWYEFYFEFLSQLPSVAAGDTVKIWMVAYDNEGYSRTTEMVDLVYTG